jgi:hypothetical protein
VADPQTLLRSRGYVGLLVVAAIIGVPVSAAAYGFLALVDYLQKQQPGPARAGGAGHSQR